MNNNRTTPGIGPGGWDSGTLAREQEEHAARLTAAAHCECTDGCRANDWCVDVPYAVVSRGGRRLTVCCHCTLKGDTDRVYL